MTTVQLSGVDALAQINPKRKERVYDLVRDAGLDVSDWSNYKLGATKPAANSRYCYEWCFRQGETHVVLNLWHASFALDGDQVCCDLNMRAYANDIARAADEPWRAHRPKPVWESRAQKMDSAIQLAARKKLPVRVIVCEGNMRDLAAGDEKASEVKNRMLDPLPWVVQAYDWDTGQTRLVRGLVEPGPSAADQPERPIEPEVPVAADVPLDGPEQEAAPAPPALPDPGYVDQFSGVLLDQGGPPDKRTVETTTYTRDPEVRMRALYRAQGVCQLCGQPGFVTMSGKIYLETHHVVPLGEGGYDALSNVVALCANDHRRAHFAGERDALRVALLALAALAPPSQ